MSAGVWHREHPECSGSGPRTLYLLLLLLPLEQAVRAGRKGQTVYNVRPVSKLIKNRQMPLLVGCAFGRHAAGYCPGVS